MLTPQVDGSLPRGPREEQAWREAGHTAVSPWTARVLVGVFLAAIAVVPLIEAFGARARAARGFAVPWSTLLDLPRRAAAHLGGALPETAGAGLWLRVVSANRAVLGGLSDFEDALEDESLIGRSLRPPAQLVLSRWLGAGNERVYLGRDRWLFYRPDVDYVTAPGFLDERQLARRVAGAAEWRSPPQPDPREAIRRFRDDLHARGIALVVMPVPVKPTVHPEMLAARYGGRSQPLHNPSRDRLLADLRRDGVLVFDPTEELLAARGPGSPQYLATDTHWRPEAMELVAERLAAFVRDAVPLPAVDDPGYRTERQEVIGSGDILQMLDLPRGQTIYPPEPVWISRRLAADGTPWRPSRDADVLLLGDSFANIYSLATMGWGDAAGLAEQLSFFLRRPLDRIVQNDEGAFATRAILRRDLAAGADRLSRTRVVIYQFAARELAFGDWQIIELPRPGAPQP